MGFFFVALRPNVGHGLLILEVFLDHTQRRTTVGRTPLDELSARRRDLYLTTHDTHNRQISMPPVGFFFIYVTLLDLRGSYIRVHNVLCSYGSQEACPLHSTKHVSSINGFWW